FMIYSLINYQDLTEVFTFASFLIKFYTTLYTNEFIFIPAPTEAKTRKSLQLISWPFILLHRDKSSSVGIVASDDLPSQEMVISIRGSRSAVSLYNLSVRRRIARSILSLAW